MKINVKTKQKPILRSKKITFEKTKTAKWQAWLKKEELLVFIAFLVLVSFIIKNNFYFGYLGIGSLMICMILLKPKWQSLIIYFFVFLLFLTLFIFFNESYSFEGLQKLSKNDNTFYYVRNLLFAWLKTNLKNQKWYGFILLTVFNFKNNANYSILKQFHFLGISYLFVVSGLHLNILFYLINVLLRKKYEKVQVVIQFLILFFYGYFLSFSLSIWRIVLQRIIKFKINDFVIAHYLSALGLILIFNNIGLNFAYLITFISVFSILEIIQLPFNNFFKLLMINFVCNLFSALLIIKISGQYNYLSLIFGLFFSPLATVYYLVTLFSFWIVWIENAQIIVFNAFLQLIDSLIYWNTIISIKKIHDLFIMFPYLIIIGSRIILKKYKNI